MGSTNPDVKSIFGRALEIEAPAERSAFLSEACASNPALKAEVEGLLRAIVEAKDFMTAPAALDTATALFAPLAEGPGTKIGPYKLLQQIGEGGMGVVYMAEQESPVRRKVALKIIKPGMDSAQVVARFEAERQALAMMDHANIARVFDAGTTDSGRPFFVMELVKGVPITEYCDANRLSPRERLELFVPVCRAIQHAHQKGVIHRDIKPSNVLVSLYDGVPVPKVIDFGVAKATDQRLTERTMFTQHGAILGTLEYMSPEQAENSALDIDTRSDVYSLGVLLYELLTGGTPLERATLREAGYVEILRRIKEEEPPRPSTRLSSSKEALATISAQRKTEPSKLAGLIRGELDWIVMKALEKDRTRRYETAVGFARDIERHLKDDAVEACPPSAGYRLRKFASKHRAAMMTASSIAALLVLAALVSTWQAIRARQAEDRAILEAKRARQAEQLTRVERDKAVSAERDAVARREEAEAARQTLRKSLYVSDIQLAHTAWIAGNRAAMGTILERQRPRPGEADLRGFEWHYLRRLGATVRELGSTDSSGSLGAMSSDGTRYVRTTNRASTGTSPGGGEIELRLLDATSGRELRRVAPYPGEAMRISYPSIQFSRDGRRFLYCKHARQMDNQPGGWKVKVFDWETGRELFARSDVENSIGATAFDHSGSRLVLVINKPGNLPGTLRDGELVIWDLESGKSAPAIPLEGRWSMPGASAAFSPDGSRLATLSRYPGPAAKDPVLQVWDASTGKELYRQDTGPRATYLAYSPDGRRIAVSYETETSHRVRDASSGRETLELRLAADSPSHHATIAFNPDGSRLACATDDGKVRIWDVIEDEARRSRAPDRVLIGNNASLRDVAWSTDGRSVLSPGQGGKILSWEIASQEERFEFQGPDETTGIVTASADSTNRHAAAFETLRGMGQTEIKVWDETGKVLFAATEPAVEGPKTSINDRFVRLNRHGTRLIYWDHYRHLAEGKNKAKYRARVWDITSGREVFRRDEVAAGFQDLRLFLSADGRLLGTQTMFGGLEKDRFSLDVRDLESGKEQRYLDGAEVRPWAFEFSPDGRHLAGMILSGTGGNLTAQFRQLAEYRHLDVATARETVRWKWSLGFPRAMARSEDGRRIAVAISTTDGGGVIKVLDAATGEELRSLEGPDRSVDQLAFSPDGRRLASANRERAWTIDINLWDLETGRELLSFRPQFFSATPVGGSPSFSSDGRRLSFFSTNSSRAVRMYVWDATPQPDDRASSRP